MSVILIVLPIALLLAAGALWLFIWSARTGQYDDMDTPSVRVLFDDDADNQHADQDSEADPASDAGNSEPDTKR